MTDLTAGRAKCLLPVGNLPLLWFPLKMLENCGFQTVIVTVPEAVQKEVHIACFYSVYTAPFVADWLVCTLSFVVDRNRFAAGPDPDRFSILMIRADTDPTPNFTLISMSEYFF
jgi:hypothetical protein